jgi:hypothetical protein
MHTHKIDLREKAVPLVPKSTPLTPAPRLTQAFGDFDTSIFSRLLWRVSFVSGLGFVAAILVAVLFYAFLRLQAAEEQLLLAEYELTQVQNQVATQAQQLAGLAEQATFWQHSENTLTTEQGLAAAALQVGELTLQGNTLETPETLTLQMGESALVGVGTATPTAKLEVAGGLRLNATGELPECTESQRGTLWVSQGIEQKPDTVKICVRNAAAKYLWQSFRLY